MLQPDRYPFRQLFRIHVGLRNVGEERVEDVYLAPPNR
jgi:hypothetical protein